MIEHSRDHQMLDVQGQSGVNRISRVNLLITVASLMLVVSAAYSLSGFLSDASRFPVEQVDVFGTLDYTDRTVLMERIQSHTNLGFYDLDIDRLREDVEQLAWVNHAFVSRVWPSTITVQVEEHEPAARWNDTGLISKQLTVFNPPQLQPNSEAYQEWQDIFRPLPLLRGTAGRQADLLDNFRQYQQKLSQSGLQLALLEENDRQAQTLRLANGSVIRLGSEQQRIRMNRFLDVYARIEAEQLAAGSAESVDQRLLSFDMRYSNGFALGINNRSVMGWSLWDQSADIQPEGKDDYNT